MTIFTVTTDIENELGIRFAETRFFRIVYHDCDTDERRVKFVCITDDDKTIADVIDIFGWWLEELGITAYVVLIEDLGNGLFVQKAQAEGAS